jgi:ribosomal protein S1
MQNEEQHVFEAFAASHPVGTKLRARVTTMRAFGAFCQLADGVDGLLLVPDFEGGPAPNELPGRLPARRRAD